ncbi:hypothetical protein SAV14893_085500 [Streptomyces avermitilis]|uniref:Uncharacterized protein n=1 Tax=Streptomyces avermitilis TaxID=33903 RepID=A0A4D4MCJ0_STRAX|nr:hypothetical protein SAVMC3_11120 [Streptomyces avermitilis]GDY69157.1 hypothetical protein SAV14893_085500 [Streptomyces avermitilis]GDY79405.1 hypothetical protein SAV31267_088900 [Streptomyces avermitilis]GDY88354.1 hypothetical protein SAVCW2_75530 [Streptomyces avermitilis]
MVSGVVPFRAANSGRRLQRHSEPAVAAGDGTGRSRIPTAPEASGADRVVKTATYTKSAGTFEVPGRTVAVFKR